METSKRARGSNSTASYTESEASLVKKALQDLNILLSRSEDSILDKRYINNCLKQTEALSELLGATDKPSTIQDAFRSLHGFRVILDLLKLATEGFQETPTTDLLLGTLKLLRIALQGHWGNRKYFSRKIEEGGWTKVHQLLKNFCLVIEQDKPITIRVYGELLVCAVHDESLSELLQNLQMVEDTQDTPGNLVKIVGSTIPSRIHIENPEVFSILLSLWSENSHVELPNLPLVLRTIYIKSTRNLKAVHDAGLLTHILKLLVEGKLPSSQLEELQVGAIELLKLGVSSLEDAKLLYANASSPRIADSLDKALQVSDGIPFVNFDMSMYGFSCIELTDLGKAFPPPANTSAGYTLSIWFKVISFDPESHTTLFGAFDPSQSCFVLVYLEKDSGNLILQTSITASRPSVRFKSYDFQDGRWYHLCIVHKRPGMTSSSRASLFVDGEFVEQVKAHFPSTPPSTSTSDGSSARKIQAVQAFMGTPRDLANNTEPGQSSSEWRLASTCLFAEALNDDLIAVYFELGPRYYGNYQDCLGSFQTYEASAALNLRNETLHAGKEDKSTIVTAIRSKAGNLVPETRVLLNISPWTVIEYEAIRNSGANHSMKLLSKDALKNLRHWTHGGQTSIATNAAIPSLNKALINLSGVAHLNGEPTVVITQALDEASWRLGGCLSIGLSLIDGASTEIDFNRALDIFFAMIKSSWRNSEAMEKENGFSIMASILTTKLPKFLSVERRVMSNIDQEDDEDNRSLLHEVLLKVLTFVGYDSESPENSVINNPLAYRVLLVDLDIWRTGSETVQRLYFEQFTVFSIGSKYHLFNAKRLSRMRITKKWLSTLKGDTFQPKTLEYFLTAFRSLLNSSLTAETHRSIAQYITYAVHKAKDRSSQLRPSKPIAMPLSEFGPISRRSTAPISEDRRSSPGVSPSRGLSRHQIGVEVLEMYSELLCQQNTANIKKFAKTVTNKWILHLITEDEPRVVVLSMKLLARVLVVNGQRYVDKFEDKTGGFAIMQYRLKKWWSIPELWTICFAILFDLDIVSLNLKKSLDLYTMLSNFPLADLKIVYTGIMPVIVAMLQNGLKSIMQSQPDPESPTRAGGVGVHARSKSNGGKVVSRTRAMSLQPPSSSDLSQAQPQTPDNVKIVQNMIRFLNELQQHSLVFRNYAATSSYVQELLFLLFPLIVSSDIVSAETELQSRDSSLTFDGHDVVIRPLSRTSHQGTPVVRTTSVESPSSPQSTKAKPLKRGSSYILITSEEPQYTPSSARLEAIASPKKSSTVRLNTTHSLLQEILELVISVFTDSIINRKDFNGLGTFFKVPPGFQEHQAYFQSFILRNTISNLDTNLKLNQKLLAEPRVLTNLQKLCTHLDEAVFEGWFIDGAEVAIDFLGELLEHLQRGDIRQLKSVRLCSEVINSLRAILARLVLMRLSELDDSPTQDRTTNFLKKLSYWQTVLFSSDTIQEEFLKLFSYLLYTKLITTNHKVREGSADLWRTMLVQKPEETSEVLQKIMGGKESDISRGFEKILEVDNLTFLSWIDDHRADLDAIFIGRLAGVWEQFTAAENKVTESNYKTRISRRRDKLRLWVNESLAKDDTLRRHEISADHWKANIYATEHIKKQRAFQDQQDGLTFNLATWKNMQKDLHRPFGLAYNGETFKSRLDMTEGRNRMRLRLLPDRDTQLQDYKPKRAASRAKKPLDIKIKNLSAEPSLAPSPTLNGFKKSETVITQDGDEKALSDNEPDDDYEMVDEPDTENYEDKNRKVMRSLQRGDTVEYVHNASRIVGLEACEGLLIVGKHAFYLMDYYFQRSDGEIVDVWQAPADERDSYMQMISGQSGDATTTKPIDAAHETRSWRWEDVLSISKRRFLFRDVGIEVFFLDGESYLLTVSTPKLRDEVYQKLMSKAQGISSGLSSTNPEDLWRVESLRSTEDSPQSFGARFTNVFTQGTTNPATKKWIKGEISNFQYLMLVNTMAGRTFNDLTQYPVFPWVLADYTSEELDLTNPRSFRDLTKPMGAQTPERQADFNDRYLSFAEMGDENAPPFHYGTHYSTSMIVTGFLLRIQPFVQSYLLLQGGAFDHPDRLFFSIEKAWSSASRENMSDVRELIPEFFYLPEMFTNENGYDFGKRQGGGDIDNVVLPRWAKGDPHIFIAKHREALESEYVSKHLHQWIDLIFGHKQRGEAALEATNVFHHLSYRGAKNLDDITDAKDREVTIKIIHNFGQTPHQVFHRPHPAKEVFGSPPKRLDNAAEMLTKLPFPLLETKDRVSSLMYSSKYERVLAAGPTRLHVPPNYDKFVDWGFTDGSLRFFLADSHKIIGLFEHIHSSQISTATFADSKTLVTAGMDSTITVWSITSSSKVVDLVAKGSLFGHKTPVTHLAVSKSFSTLASASTDGTVLLWDLNRLAFIRVIESPSSDTVASPLRSLTMSTTTGMIGLSHLTTTSLYTLNGHPLVKAQQTCPETDESISSLAFFTGSNGSGTFSAGNDYLSRDLIFTGHKYGVVNIWNLVVHDGNWMLEHVRRLNHIDTSGANIQASITSILPGEKGIWVGDEDGRVWEWNCLARV